MLKINSHNEWDKLKEVIVGSAVGTHGVTTWPSPEPIPEWKQKRAAEIQASAHPQWLLDEIQEDLDGLAAALSDWGAKVLRPDVHDIRRRFSSPFWESTGNNSYNVRDLHLVVGNSVVESPSHVHSRFFEPYCLYAIWYEYFKQGFRWIAAPKPRLEVNPTQSYFRSEDERVLSDEDLRFMELTGGRIEELHRLLETEILFEAANTLRMGRDLLYLVSCSGNRLGAKWLQSVLGDEYRVHQVDNLYRSSHIDSTVLCLRPGLVVLNSKRANPSNCPPIFQGWEKIWFDDVAPTSESELQLQREVRDPLHRELTSMGFESNLGQMSSPWVGMNFLSLDTHTVVVDKRQTSLIRTLEQHKVTCIPVQMRHIYTQGGGIHCATLDTVREGVLEDYFTN